MVTWLIEPEAFGEHYKEFETSIKSAGHSVIYWHDDYTDPEKIPTKLRFIEGPVIFHGSLGTAYHVSRRWLLVPGTFGSLKPFECTSYYSKTLSWRLNQEYIVSTVENLCNGTWQKLWEKQLPLKVPETIFVRPSSPLKQFSGRILHSCNITPSLLDHGFYYNDLNLTTIVAPVKKISQEWRFVVVNKAIITGSAYTTNRLSIDENIDIDILNYANEIAAKMEAPSVVYILDICNSEDGPRLLELNPFSGADLYGCDYDIIVKTLSELATKLF